MVTSEDNSVGGLSVFVTNFWKRDNLTVVALTTDLCGVHSGSLK